jgi:hypothetical protein
MQYEHFPPDGGMTSLSVRKELGGKEWKRRGSFLPVILVFENLAPMRHFNQ